MEKSTFFLLTCDLRVIMREINSTSKVTDMINWSQVSHKLWISIRDGQVQLIQPTYIS